MLNDPILVAFDRRRQRCPSGSMLVSSHHRASAEDVWHLAGGVTRQLTASGVGAGSLVGLAAGNGPGFLAGFLAIRRLGSVALLIDGRTPVAEKARIADALGAAAILECPRAWPRDEAGFSISPVVGNRERRQRTEEMLTADIAVVKLTSGSTGAPRGILAPSSALIADDAALAATMGLAEDERILAAIPMSHSYGWSSMVMPALMRDATLVLPDPANPLAPMAVAREQEVTFFPTVPAYLKALVKMSSPPPAPRSLRLVISAGAPLNPRTAKAFRKVYGQPVHVFYGASECGGVSFDRLGDAGERGSLGTPVEGVRIELEAVSGNGALGTEHQGFGAVVVSSGAVARGYLPDPDSSLSRGCFRTQDLGCLRAGELHLEGRLDEWINVRGKKVNPREVESVLNHLEGVDDTVTLGIRLPDKDENIVRSFVACEPGSLTSEKIQEWCRCHLAEYKVPRSIVLLDEIPRTDRGKLDRNALLKAPTRK